MIGHRPAKRKTAQAASWCWIPARGECAAIVGMSWHRMTDAADQKVNDLGKNSTLNKRAYIKQWRKENKEHVRIQYIRWRKLRYVKLYKIVNDAKRGGCVKCGLMDLRCLDMHHKDPTMKTGCIPLLINSCITIENLKKELRNCDPVCANCHRIEHYEEQAQQRKLKGLPWE